MIEEFDVLIIGAGLSGIDAAYHLQTTCPAKRFAILEGRASLGGTWDLFRYPGIRSDSDMYTLGFPFHPWTNPKAIADGDSILAYLQDTAARFGIDRKIRFRHRVERARWSSADARWTLDVRDEAAGTHVTLCCRFLFACAGYFDYRGGYTPELPGRDRFRGRIVHPQEWTPEVTYDGQRVVVIGSGATAVTLVPTLAERAAHVTMLQRSPTYILSRPSEDSLAAWIRRRLPERHAFAAARWKSVLLGMAFYEYCRRFPEHAKKLLVAGVARELGKADAAAHFSPAYNPWDQRLCMVPDGDLFRTLKAGRASVVTDHIETFDATGLQLRSGAHLDADLVVTATGLVLQAFGGIELVVDGAPVELGTRMAYRGMMLSDVPNFAFSIGYTNASWTLKSDLTSRYVCRLLGYMDAHGHRTCCPRRDPAVAEAPIIDFTSGYVLRALDRFPRAGAIAPWRLYQNYVLDLLALGYGRVSDPSLELA